MTELVEKCLWAFSEHQLSEGPEVPGSQGAKKKDSVSVEEKLTDSEFQYLHLLSAAGLGTESRVPARQGLFC